jgi:hypothetical protein
MDNIQAPQGGQPPQGPPGGSTDQDNPPVGGQPANPDASQDQSQMPGPPSAGGEIPPPTEGGPPQDQGAAPPTDNQGQVEDVLEGTEGAAASPQGEGQASAAPPPGQSTEPYGPAPGIDNETPPAGTSPPEAMAEQPPSPPDMAGDQNVTPQSQPDFTGGEGGMPPAPGQGPPGPQKAGGSKWLSIVLVIVIILALGGLTIAYLKDYISLPFLDKLLGREQPTQETTTAETQTQETAFPEDQQRKNDLAQIKGALEKYFEGNQKYPIAAKIEKISDAKSTAYQALVPDYIETMPNDPASPTKFYGYQSVDGTSFELSAVLDNTEDTEGIQKGDLYLYLLTNKSSVEG